MNILKTEKSLLKKKENLEMKKQKILDDISIIDNKLKIITEVKKIQINADKKINDKIKQFEEKEGEINE